MKKLQYSPDALEKLKQILQYVTQNFIGENSKIKDRLPKINEITAGHALATLRRNGT